MWQYIGVSVIKWIITVCMLPYEFSHCKILVMSFMFFTSKGSRFKKVDDIIFHSQDKAPIVQLVGQPTTA